MRWYLYVLVELVVVSISGTLIGPVIGGTWGYLWGYLSGWVGPITLLLLAGSCVPLILQRFGLAEESHHR